MVSLYNNHLNGILADEMGLGKTVQVCEGVRGGEGVVWLLLCTRLVTALHLIGYCSAPHWLLPCTSLVALQR